MNGAPKVHHCPDFFIESLVVCCSVCTSPDWSICATIFPTLGVYGGGSACTYLERIQYQNARVTVRPYKNLTFYVQFYASLVLNRTLFTKHHSIESVTFFVEHPLSLVVRVITTSSDNGPLPTAVPLSLSQAVQDPASLMPMVVL
jgi:hypothetical protein